MSSADLTVLRYIRESIIGTTPDDSARATGVLTGTANLANADTVTIGGRTYTLQTVLTNVNGNVKIAATLALTLINLFNAINGEGGGVPGVDYATATEPHAQVDASAYTATTLTVRAKVGGTAGNAIATTDVGINASWGAATLAGGTNSAITALKQLRYTGESLNYQIENIQTAEIRPDRTETDLIQTGASASGDINVELSYGTFDDFLESVLCGAWAANELENGSTLTSYTIQKHFQDMSVPQFHNYRGSCIEGLSLKMEIGKIVEGSFKIMSFGIDPDTGVTTAQIGGATFPAVSTTVPMNAVTNLQDFSIGGVPYSGCISSLSLEIKNNIRAIKCIGSINPTNMKLGTIEVTGDLEFYFNEGSNYAKFVAGTEFDFSFALEDDTGNRYTLTFPRNKFETGEVMAGGKNSDVMFSAKYRSLYHAASDRVIHVLRTPA